MPPPLFLLKCVGKAALNLLGGGVAGDLLFEALPDLASDAWKWWCEKRDPEQRRQDLAALAQASPAGCRDQIQDILLEFAADRPAAQQEALALYLSLLPAQVRKSLRRPSDPTGTTVAAELAPAKADDLLTVLPAKLPRFRPGDRPLSGVDWELDELLGVGGFGEVWRARNPLLQSVPPVALKFCLDRAAAGALRNEAAVLDRVMRQGRHPGIVALQHTYLSAETPCLEYELVSGGDLSGLIREWHRGGERPAPVVVCRALRDLADIVGFAHSHGIIHRDLKPANVLRQRGPDGSQQLKVADFGIGGVATRQAIARHTAGAAGASASRGLFLATALRGSCTPLYASPQQMRGEAPDPRDDVYALGVIWYQMLTGDLTHGRPGGSRWQRRLAELGLDPRLIDLLSECFEDSPEDRVPDAGELARRLRDVVGTPTPTPAPTPTVVVSAPRSSSSSEPQWRREAPPAGAEQARRRQEELGRLLTAADRAVVESPGDAALLARRGELHRQLGMQEAAIRDCTAAIRLDARCAAAYATRGSAYRMKGQVDLAMADCTEAIRLGPQSVLAWYTRGELSRVKGDLELAVADCTEAARLDPSYSWAYGTRGAAFRQKGDFAAAIADLSAALRLCPDNDFARHQLALAQRGQR